MSNERERRERLEKTYGSFECSQEKWDLMAKEYSLGQAYKASKAKTEDDALEEIGATPWFMCQFRLRMLPLALLGAPEGSKEWGWIVDSKTEARANRKDAANNAFYRDYTADRWPKEAGTPVRYVTPEEDLEIARRLRSGALTRPGSEVATVDYTLAELMTNPPEKPAYLIEGLLRQGGAMMVFGPSGVGKSWFVQTLILMLARGHGCGVISKETGRYVLRAGEHMGVNVALIDGENVVGDLIEHARLLCDGLKLHPTGTLQMEPAFDADKIRAALLADPDVDPIDLEDWVEQLSGGQREEQEGDKQGVPEGLEPVDLSKVRIAPKTRQDHRAKFIDLVDPTCHGPIVSYCQKHKIDVLVLDNLSTLAPSLEDENQASEWAPFNDLVVALKAAGIATVIVHHTAKDGGNYRGSSNLETTMETIIGLKKPDGPSKGRGACFSVESKKDRTHGQSEVIGKTLMLKDGKWCVKVDEFESAKRVVELVGTLRFTTQQDLADELGVSQPTISRIFTVAEELGLKKAAELKATLRKAAELMRKLASPFPPEDEEEKQTAADIEALNL